jgi:hypothetical protein
MGGQAMANVIQQLISQNPVTQEPYVNKPINTAINPYPSIGQMFPNLNNQLLSGNLTAPNMQQYNPQQNSGVGRFSGLLGSPIVTSNTQGK